MIQYAIIAAVYIAGIILCKKMLDTQHACEEEVTTNKDVVVASMLSSLSWLMILICLVTAWFEMTNKNGYWNKPVKEEKDSVTEKKATK